jgi:PAS domain S-box-containing protein
LIQERPSIRTIWGERDHFVQFYEEDDVLVNSVAAFIGAGLVTGQAGIVIATLAHREALSRSLTESGLDLRMLQSRGQLVFLDAAETLASLMRNGSPDKALFEEVVGSLVRKTASGRSGLRAFGEMVALLWSGGNPLAAIGLEELWNELGETVSFSLMCGYPMKSFGKNADIEPFQHICRAHSRVIPAESYALEDSTEDERARTIAALQQKAAALEAEVFRRQKAEERRERVEATLRETQRRLETELEDTKLLQKLSSELVSGQSLESLFQKLVNAAVAIMHSDFASMQMFYPERGTRGELRLLASHGFNEEAQRCWEWVSHETASSCGEVLRSGRRVIAKNVQECEFLIRLGGLQAYLAAGIHAMQSTPLISRDGKLVGMISTHWREAQEPSERDLRLFDILTRQAADVIERTKAEENLRESEERYRNLFDSIAQGFCTIEVIFDESGHAVDYRFLLVNPAFEGQTGIANAVGKRMREIAPLHEEHWFETFGKIAMTGEACRFERHAAQLGRYYEVYGWRVGSPKERKVGILFNDITARKRAEESERRLAAIVEYSDDAIISIDLDAVITSWNEGAERLYGHSAEEAIGQPVTILIPQNRENEEPGLLSRIRRGETVAHYETVRCRKDGTPVDISLTISPLKDSDGRVVGASKVARDITEKVRAREMLEQTVADRTAQLRDTVAELEAFSYSIAHDMRAPLRSMNGYARFLAQDFAEILPEEGKEFLRRISSGAGRLDELITDVLNYSKISRSEISLETVEIERLTREIIESYPSLSESGATILVQTPMPPVMANAAALTQCLSNLISNAIKFVPRDRKAHVRIRAETVGEVVRLSVEDNGIGITEDGRKRIFRMFQRLNPSAEFEGTGIGLTIVRKAVARMGGQVGVESEPGAGSVFWIELRRAA